MTSAFDRLGHKSLCGVISVVLFWTSFGTQIGFVPALIAMSLLLIAATLLISAAKFVLRVQRESPETFLRVHLWTSGAVATSVLLMHPLGVLYGSAGGWFIPETATTAIATIFAATVAATCLTRLFNEKLEIFRRIPRGTTWLLSFSTLNILLMLPSAILFACAL
jgi:hypothetical protein